MALKAEDVLAIVNEKIKNPVTQEQQITTHKQEESRLSKEVLNGNE